MPDYRRYYAPNQSVFITFVTHDRRPWLGYPLNAELLLDAMRRVKEKYPFRQIAHAVLPDHFHWMFKTPDGANFSAIASAVKRETTWRLKERGRSYGTLWQERFYDHVIRDDDDFARHLDYIHFNPVKHGVAASAAEYPHSSFRQ